MSKKKQARTDQHLIALLERKSKKSSPPRVPASVAAAMRAANRGGQYGSAIATKAMIEELGAMTRGMYKKPARHKLTKEEKKARARVLAAHRASAAGAARLGRRKKRSKVAPRKKAASRAAAPAPQRRTSKKVRTVTADQAIKEAAQRSLRRWLCEGPRRSGCGAGGSRVITGKGSFKRLRPPRFMTAGG